jgi:hypothetical protein
MSGESGAPRGHRSRGYPQGRPETSEHRAAISRGLRDAWAKKKAKQREALDRQIRRDED